MTATKDKHLRETYLTYCLSNHSMLIIMLVILIHTKHLYTAVLYSYHISVRALTNSSECKA